MPVFVHVIDHPDARVLVDTGMTELHPAVADLDPRLCPLSEQDFDLAGIDIVVNTHLHFDHCGGNHLFAGKPIYVQRRELDDARSEDDYTIREWVEAPGVRYVPVDGELELLPGLRLVPAPGHTRGMQVVVVETGGRPVVVGGDVAVWFGELDEPHTEGQLRVRASTPSWSGSRTSTSRGDPRPSEALRLVVERTTTRQTGFVDSACLRPRRLKTNSGGGHSSVRVRDYPTRSVRLIDPFGVGGGPDLIARAVAEPLSELWGQPVTVENYPGAGSTAGPALVARSPADGYTLLVSTSAHAYSASFKTSLPYDPLDDFVPIAPLTSQPYVLVASMHLGVTTLAELISAAKTRPDAIRFSSSGMGTATHVAVEKLNLEVLIEAVHVPARGTDAIADTISQTVAGRTDYALSPISVALPHIREHRLAPLGVSTSRRSQLLPTVPTLAEAGAAAFDFPIWYGLWAPVGTPARTVRELSESIARVLTDPALRGRLREHDADVMRMSQTDFAQFVLSESESAARIIEASGSLSTDLV